MRMEPSWAGMKTVGIGDQENSPWSGYQAKASDSNLEQQRVWLSESASFWNFSVDMPNACGV